MNEWTFSPIPEISANFAKIRKFPANQHFLRFLRKLLNVSWNSGQNSSKFCWKMIKFWKFSRWLDSRPWEWVSVGSDGTRMGSVTFWLFGTLKLGGSGGALGTGSDPGLWTKAGTNGIQHVKHAAMYRPAFLICSIHCSVLPENPVLWCSRQHRNLITVTWINSSHRPQWRKGSRN